VKTMEWLQMAAFQSTPLREGRHGALVDAVGVRSVFQSTPLREGRRGPSNVSLSGSSFNPRPCARGDKTARFVECAL